MDKAVLEKRILLDSKYLTKDIKQHICNKLVEVTKEECSKDYGYIIEIIKILEIKGHEIGRVNFDNIFTVIFEAYILNPVSGAEFEGVVCLIYKDGVFVNILDKQKMLIPKESIKDYKFDEDKNIYKKGDSVIAQDTKVKVRVTASQYRKKSFSCFGSLI
jgi:DNA-directed RNA polymerase subunit E'/Rpb7